MPIFYLKHKAEFKLIMKKPILLLISFLIFSQNIFSQDNSSRKSHGKHDQEKYNDAIHIYLEALEIATTIDDQYNTHICKTNLGSTYQLIGEYQQAKRFCSEALTSAEEINNVLQNSFIICTANFLNFTTTID